MIVRKRFYLLPIFCLLFFASATPVLAQLSYGVRLTSGAQISHFQGWEQSSVSTYTRMGLGMFLAIPLREKVKLQPELNYLAYPYALSESHTLSIPLLLTYGFSPHIEVEAGPSLERDFRYSSSPDINPYINVGVNAGFTFWFSKYWSGNVRFTYELVRRTYDGAVLFSGEGHPIRNDDPLLVSSGGPEPGYRDMFLMTSIRYSIK
ncbi:hypothetical protein [Cesiribacter sp. SM1]|uniref:hypothetical protein n=1 Tax=Cesiribacter sp. SM1 TaxID=2861196 RepID=UPI001CD7C843|nr:hypothetical protein [Cesiribacter sp. SM1]